MRQPRAAFVILLLWLAALTFAFHDCPGCESLFSDRTSVSLARKMLLAVETLHVSSSVSAAGRQPQDQQRHNHHHHHHHHQQHHRLHGKWNWQGIPPSAAGKADPRYGAEKRLVPTGPNPLHH
uniref:Uncharacterized protein n=1 Tax=Avena sativa TaxID=4498 RepID=A0ACD5YQN9_AVESA